MKTLVLEIGTEELPLTIFPEILDQMEMLFSKYLQQANLTWSKIKIMATSRRLTVMVTGFPEKQTGKEIEVMIDGVSDESEYMLEGRTRGQALEIDGKVLTNDGTAKPGEIVKVRVEQNFNYDLLGPIVRNEIN